MPNTTYTYSASVMMGLCEGPVLEVPRIWRGKNLYSGGYVPAQILLAEEAYPVPASVLRLSLPAQAFSAATSGSSASPLTTTEGWPRCCSRCECDQ